MSKKLNYDWKVTLTRKNANEVAEAVRKFLVKRTINLTTQRFIFGKSPNYVGTFGPDLVQSHDVQINRLPKERKLAISIRLGENKAISYSCSMDNLKNEQKLLNTIFQFSRDKLTITENNHYTEFIAVYTAIT